MDENVLLITETLSIPEAELTFRFSTSGGPGGQHANRSATRVTLLFDIANSPALSDEIRSQLLAGLAKRVDQNGILSLTVQETRSQYQNRALAIARFQRLLAKALQTPPKRHKTKPSKRARERRLEAKRLLGEKKQKRSRNWEED